MDLCTFILCNLEEKVYLVAYGLGAAPFKEDLFDAAGAGHPETLRALQFGFGVHWFGTTAQEKVGQMYENICIHCCFQLLPKCSIRLLLPVGCFRLESFKDGPTSLSANVARQSLRPHQFPPPLSNWPKGPATVCISISVGPEHTWVRLGHRTGPVLKDVRLHSPVMVLQP